MPSKKKAGHTAVLAHVVSGVHRQADDRRRAERLTWAKLITTLLQRYAAGAADAALSAPVRRPRELAPDSAVQGDRRANSGWVDPASITWHRSLSRLVAADAARKGKAIPAGALDALDDAAGEEVSR